MTQFPSFSNDALPKPHFTVERENNSNSGQIKLSWESDAEAETLGEITFELQQSKSQDYSEPKTIYKGEDLASFISGLPNGNYYYRVRTVIADSHSNWSETVSLKVEHQSLKLAFILFSIGSIVFLMTTYVVWNGVRTVAKEEI